MTRFDDGYDRGTVVRPFFGHAAGGEEGRPFARQDVVVRSSSDDAITGHKASVSDKSRGSLRGDEDDDPTNDVRVHARPVTVRKSAVVMKRVFGNVADEDVAVRKDPTGEWGVDDEDGDDDQTLIADGGSD